MNRFAAVKLFLFYWCLNRNLRGKNYQKILFLIFTEKMATLAEIVFLQLSIQFLHVDKKNNFKFDCCENFGISTNKG